MLYSTTVKQKPKINKKKRNQTKVKVTEMARAVVIVAMMEEKEK